MTTEIKPQIPLADSLALLDIRLGQITSVDPAVNAKKGEYVIQLDFGKFGTRTSVGRFSHADASVLVGTKVPCVLNFPPVDIDGYLSEVLVLGVQFPKAPSGEATPLVPQNSKAKIGGKVF